MNEKCGRCRVGFEPKTTRVVRSEFPVLVLWHVGCMEAQRQKNNDLISMRKPHPEQIKDGIVTVKKAKCVHYTPAEDSSRWAFAHRTWGCPDEGAVWPHGYND